MRILFKNRTYITFPAMSEDQEGWEINGVYFDRASVEAYNEQARAYERTTKRLEASRLLREVRKLSR